MLHFAKSDPAFIDGVAWLDVMGAEQTDFYSDRGYAPVGRNTSYHVAPSQRSWAYNRQHVDLVFAISRVHGVHAPFAFWGHMNAVIAAAYFDRALLPDLSQHGIELVIADGGSYWAEEGPQTLLRPIFARHNLNLLYLPPYTPWLNPIEKVNGWIKGKMKSDLGIDRLDPIGAIRQIVARVTPALCRSFIDFLYG